jgi:hypothetical protein
MTVYPHVNATRDRDETPSPVSTHKEIPNPSSPTHRTKPTPSSVPPRSCEAQNLPEVMAANVFEALMVDGEEGARSSCAFGRWWRDDVHWRGFGRFDR